MPNTQKKNKIIKKTPEYFFAFPAHAYSQKQTINMPIIQTEEYTYI